MHIYQTDTELFFENGIKLGEILCDVDGYYKFFPEVKSGYWDTYVLREIADHVDKLNEEWNKKVEEELDRLNRC